MNTWYFALLIFASNYLKTKALSAKGHFLEKASHRHVVLVVDTEQKSFEKFLCTGIVLNTRWVLTIADPVKYVYPSQLAIAVGSKIPINSNFDTGNMIEVWRRWEEPDGNIIFSYLFKQFFL